MADDTKRPDKRFAIPTDPSRFKFMGYFSVSRSSEVNDGMAGNTARFDIEIPVAECPRCGSLVLWSSQAFHGHTIFCPGWEARQYGTMAEGTRMARQKTMAKTKLAKRASRADHNKPGGLELPVDRGEGLGESEGRGVGDSGVSLPHREEGDHVGEEEG